MAQIHDKAKKELDRVEADLKQDREELDAKLLKEETDDRYRYLVRNGKLVFVEAGSLTIFVEL